MFEILKYHASGQFDAPTVGKICELMVWYDSLELHISHGGFDRIILDFYRRNALDCLLRLMQEQRLKVTLDNFPLGEAAEAFDLVSTYFSGGENSIIADLSAPAELAEGQPVYFPREKHLRDTMFFLAANSGNSIAQRDYTLIEDILDRAVHIGEVGDEPEKSLFEYCCEQIEVASETDWVRQEIAQSVGLPVYEIEFLDVERQGIACKSIKVGTIKTLEVIKVLSLFESVSGALQSNLEFEPYLSSRGESIVCSVRGDLLRRWSVDEELMHFSTQSIPGIDIESVIEAGEVTLHSFCDLLPKRNAFGNLVRGFSPDEMLSKQYIEEINANFLSKTPLRKFMRWAVFFGFGVYAEEKAKVLSDLLHASIATEIALDAFDQIVLESLLSKRGARAFVERDIPATFGGQSD